MFRHAIWRYCVAASLVFFLSGIPASRSRAQNEEKELFFVAERAFEDGFYDVAIRYIDEFLTTYPQSERLFQLKLLLGQCYFFKDQYLKAFDIFQDLVQKNELKDASLYWLGECYLKAKDYEQARKSYKELIDLYPNSVYTPQAYYSSGWSYFEQKNFGQAEKTFEELIAKFPDSQLLEDATLKIAECQYNQGQYLQAIESFQKFLSQYPQSQRLTDAYYNIAEGYYYLENYAEALNYYKKSEEAAREAKSVVLAKVSQGWVNIKLKNFEEARAVLDAAEKNAEEKNVFTDEIYLAKATLFHETGENEKAVEAYDQLIARFPDSPRILEAHLGKGNIFYQMQKYPEAIEEYQQIISNFSEPIEPEDVIEKAYFGLAWTHLKMGDIDQSVKSFRDILGKTRNKVVKVSALTQIGDAYQDEDQMEKAIEIYDQILKEFPDSLYSDYVQYRQAIALLKLNRIDAAVLAFQSLRVNFPKSRYIQDVEYYLGVAYFKNRDWKRAIEGIEEFLRRAEKQNEFISEANYILGLSYLNSGKPEEAVKIFQKIIRLYPSESDIARNAEFGLAKGLFLLGDEKESLKKFKIIAYKYPFTEAEFESLLFLAQHYAQLSDYAQAETYYLQMFEHFSSHEKINELRYELGKIYEAQEAFEKALNQYKSISRDHKEMYAQAQISIAEIFSKELDPTQAIASYQSIINDSPDFQRDAYLKIAQIYRNKQEFDQEMAIYQKALKTGKGLSSITNAELQFAIGEVYESLNQEDAAIDAYLKIPYLYSKEIVWVIKAYLRVARIFEDREDWENARITYRKILEYKTEESTYAQERLDWIETNAL